MQLKIGIEFLIDNENWMKTIKSWQWCISKRERKELRRRKDSKTSLRKINGLEKFIDGNKSFSQIFDLIPSWFLSFKFFLWIAVIATNRWTSNSRGSTTFPKSSRNHNTFYRKKKKLNKYWLKSWASYKLTQFFSIYVFMLNIFHFWSC